jgi:molybdopterin synthase sulfur carrier subunit
MDVSSLKELAEILSDDEEMKKWLAKCAVAVNDTMVNDLGMILKAGDRVTILPPVCGG